MGPRSAAATIAASDLGRVCFFLYPQKVEIKKQFLMTLPYNSFYLGFVNYTATIKTLE